MSARALGGALFGAALIAAGAARATDAPATTPSPTPVAMVVDLQNAQALVAQGDQAAFAAQPAMLHEIAVAFAVQPPEVWKNRDNVMAAVAFVLSGGQPRTIARLLESGVIAKEDEPLVRGALAYETGREREAATLLDGIDARALDLRVAGQVAFVQSVLMTGRDKKKAAALLDLARLLSPGGLVEEAALRREILLVGDLRDVDRFTALSGQYMNRFPHSAYAGGFMKGFALAVGRLGLADDVENFQKFDNLIGTLAPDRRRALFLTIARAALLHGKFAVADSAAEKVLLQHPHDPADDERAQVYQGGARIISGDYDAAVAELKSVNARMLDKRDATLLAAIREVAARLHAPLVEAPPSHAAASDGAPASPPPDDKASKTIALAEVALKRSASALADPKP
jgi:chemotaxis protein MotC